MKRRSQNTIGAVEFIDRVIKLDEKGEPFSLAPYQRRVLEMALRLDASGELVFRLVVLSEPKKSGKTFLAACLVLWWDCTRHHTEIILVANDEEQATGRVFKTAVDLITARRSRAYRATSRARPVAVTAWLYSMRFGVLSRKRHAGYSRS
jgi:phage terminase large subunit-like protein